MPLLVLLERAFEVQLSRISGPNWLGNSMFDIVAKVPAGASKQQYPMMFRNLLIDRFKMQYHTESPVTSVYALVVSPEGLKLKEGIADPDPENYGLVNDARSGSPGTRSLRAPGLGVYHVTSANGIVHYELDNVTMKALIDFIGADSGMLDLPVVDMTGLGGSYQVYVDITSGQMRCGSAAPIPSGTKPCPWPASRVGTRLGRPSRSRA